MKFITIIISGIRYLVFEDGSKVKIPENSIMGEFLFNNAEKIIKVLQTPSEVSKALIDGLHMDVILQYGRVDFTNGVPDVVWSDVATDAYIKSPSDSNFYQDICR